MRYKAKPITPVDGVLWKGDNLAEVQAICPDVMVTGSGTTHGKTLGIPATGSSPMQDLPIGKVLLKNVTDGGYTTLDPDIFNALYVIQ